MTSKIVSLTLSYRGVILTPQNKSATRGGRLKFLAYFSPKGHSQQKVDTNKFHNLESLLSLSRLVPYPLSKNGQGKAKKISSNPKHCYQLCSLFSMLIFST